MTQNQIAWYKASEERRHNLSVEAETGRHNLEDESIRMDANLVNREANAINDLHFTRMDKENFRHNQAAESISWFQSQEQKRHNKVGERQSQTSLKQRNKEIAENRRHNAMTEHISRYQSKEQKRHNLATEGIDWANVGIGRQNAATNRQNAASNWQNALTNMSNVNLRSQELDLARDRYSLDQWSTANTIGPQIGKTESETDLNKAKIDYQQLQNDYYLVDKVGNIVGQAVGQVPTIEEGNLGKPSKTRPKVNSPKIR